jgi:pre-mRNA-splicing factor ATP-dependent RNA helicase DHX16
MIEKNKKYKLIEDSDEEVMAPPVNKKIKKEKKSEDSSSDDEDQKQRVRDLNERDEFSERLKLKDKDKQRNVVTVAKGIFSIQYL